MLGVGDLPLTSQGYDLIGNDQLRRGQGEYPRPHGNGAGARTARALNGNLIGPTQTHALLAGSPAVERGNPATPGSGGNACEATDQRGVSRTQALAGPCDIGAYEAMPPPTTTTTTPPPPRPRRQQYYDDDAHDHLHDDHLDLHDNDYTTSSTTTTRPPITDHDDHLDHDHDVDD